MVGKTISHYQILDKLGEAGWAPTRCRWSPGVVEIAPDNARSLQRSGFLGRIGVATLSRRRIVLVVLTSTSGSTIRHCSGT